MSANNSKIFKYCPNKYFVETGSCEGYGIIIGHNDRNY